MFAFHKKGDYYLSDWNPQGKPHAWTLYFNSDNGIIWEHNGLGGRL